MKIASRGILVIVFALALSLALVGCSSSGAPSDSSTPASSEQSDNASAPETSPFEGDFSAGNYVAGYDFPAGRYNITAVSGTGNIFSSNQYSGGLNEMIGVDDSSEFSDLYIDSFTGASFDEGVVVTITGDVTVHFQCDAAETGTQKSRTATTDEVITLESGNFLAGTDFPAGTYTITAVSGTGNVSSSNLFDGGINEMMGIADGEFSDMYLTEFKNCELPEGTTLEISGVTVSLTPVGEIQ